MAYASLSDVQARAGGIRRAWTATSMPSLDDIQGFLDQAAADLDLLLGARGVSTPLTGDSALSLVSPNADRALVLALDATYPGGGAAPSDVTRLHDDAEARWEATLASLRDGSHPVILAELLIEPPAAASLWSSEPFYDPNSAAIAGTFNRHLDPVIRRAMLM